MAIRAGEKRKGGEFVRQPKKKKAKENKSLVDEPLANLHELPHAPETNLASLRVRAAEFSLSLAMIQFMHEPNAGLFLARTL